MTPTDDAGSELQRRNAVAALRKNLAAFEALQRELTHHAGVSRALIGALEGDARLLDTLEAVRSHEIRPVLTSAIRSFEQSRHRARMRLIAVAMGEGAGDEDVRHLWSISQEMVRRAKKELAEAPVVEEPPPGE